MPTTSSTPPRTRGWGERIAAVALASALAAGVPASVGAQSCAGDCNGDGVVTVSELTLGVRIALGDLALAACAGFDANGDRTVGVADLLVAVNHLLQDDCNANDSALRSALSGSQTAIGFIQIIDLGRASAGSAGTAGALGGAAGLRDAFPPFAAPCPDAGEVVIACATDGMDSLLTLTFAECFVCDRPPLLDTQLPRQLANARDIVVDGLFRELLADPLLCATFNAPILPGTSFQQELDGLLEYTDASSGLRFTQGFSGLLITGVIEADGRRRFELDGGVEDCEGLAELQTLESIVIAPGAACPSSGRLRAVSGSRVGEFRYTAGGGIELDDGADGTVDVRLADCRQSLASGCALSVPPPPECTGLRTQCRRCTDDTTCGDGRQCRPCARDCTGAVNRCAPFVLFASCADGIF